MSGTESVAEKPLSARTGVEGPALALRLTQAEQQERERIAGVLHDDLQYLLFSLQRHLICLQRDGGLGARRALILEQMKQVAEQAITTTRTLTTQLSPPVLKERNLHFFFRWLVLHFRALYELEVRLDLSTPLQLDDDDLRTLLYVTVQELVMNVVRHAGVDWARIRMTTGQGKLVLRVEDEGRGFDVTSWGKLGGGLCRARERVALMKGSLVVRSTLGAGTCVDVLFPL